VGFRRRSATAVTMASYERNPRLRGGLRDRRMELGVRILGQEKVLISVGYVLGFWDSLCG
jgi:hypothetical protein